MAWPKKMVLVRHSESGGRSVKDAEWIQLGKEEDRMLNSDAYLEFLFYLGMCPVKWGKKCNYLIRAAVPYREIAEFCPLTAVCFFKNAIFVNVCHSERAGIALKLPERLSRLIMRAADASMLDLLGMAERKVRLDLLKATEAS